MQSEQQDSILQGHLPECPTTTDPHGLDDGYACPCECQCEILRACEERLREGWCVSTCGNTHYTIGYEEALDAAREAVAKEAEHGPLYSVRNSGDAQRGWDAMSRHALAAIDALRENADRPAVSENHDD